jgi:coatomer protein complex subunit gamma
MKVKETEVFIVVSSLTKDMNSTEYAFKANSMKVLAKIIDPENLPSIDRYLKQAIMDKNLYVQKGALMSGIILFNKATENIKKWSNEVQDKLNSDDPQILYLSLALMSMIKSNDLFAASRVHLTKIIL